MVVYGEFIQSVFPESESDLSQGHISIEDASSYIKECVGDVEIEIKYYLQQEDENLPRNDQASE